MTNRRSRAWHWRDGSLLAVVTVLGALPRALRIDQPPTFSFDEVYYVPAARAYLTGDFNPNFEHPPLAKWLMALSIELVGDDPLGWRLPALVAGIATIPLTFLLVRRLFGSTVWATVASVLVASDGLLIGQSRVGILDSLLPPLVVGAAFCLVVHVDTRQRASLSPWLLGGGALLGAAVAVKWQAAPALAGVAAAFAVAGRRDRLALRNAAVAFVAVPLAVYVASYAGHLADGLGPGDWLGLQRDMVDYHRTYRVRHPRDSTAWTWLWLQRPVPFGSLRHDGRVSIHMAFGNPVLWWSFLASLPVLVSVWWRRRDRVVELVLLAWVSLHAVWLLILRPGFLFYLTPLVPFMAVGVTWVLRQAWEHSRPGRVLAPVVVFASVVVAARYLPVWTFLEISEERYQDLMLFDGWEN